MEESESLKYKIGNWVWIDFHRNGQPIIDVQITAIDRHNFTVEAPSEIEINGQISRKHQLNRHDIAGKPLTEKILIDLDFVHDTNPTSNYYLLGNGAVYLLGNIPNQYFIVQKPRDITVLSNVRYLHQLQNCFQEEFGIELIYEPIIPE